MRQRILIVICILSIAFCAFGQGNSCIDYTNLDAALCQYGSFSQPNMYTGQVNYGPKAVESRHTVHTDTTERDARTGYVMRTTLPDGRPAVRLGNWKKGKEAERITYTYQVPADKPILILYYAAVLENPGHKAHMQPRFTMDLLDKYGRSLSASCFSFDFVSGVQGMDNWNFNYKTRCWKNWTTMGVNLSAFIGQTIKIQFTTYDCGYPGHWGYAYFGLDCSSDKMRATTCGPADSTTAFIAPAGFNYRWYAEDQPGKIISTAQSIVPQQANVTYNCDVINTENPNCYFTLSAKAGARYPLADFDASQHHGYCGDTIFLTNLSGISSDSITINTPRESCDAYEWSFGDGRTSTAEQPGYVIYTQPGTYTITLKAGLNDWSCTSATKSYTFTVVAGEQEQVLYDTICAGDFITLGDTILRTNGTYTKDVIDPNCNMIVHVTRNVNVIEPVTVHVWDTICENGVYDWHGKPLTVPGVYEDTLLTRRFKCDSITILHLTVMPISIMGIEYDTICYGECFIWHNKPYCKAGLHADTVLSSCGCDSITYLHLSFYDIHNYVPPRMRIRLRQSEGEDSNPSNWNDPYTGGSGTLPDDFTPPFTWEDPYLHDSAGTISGFIYPDNWQDPYLPDSTKQTDSVSDIPPVWADPYMLYVERDTICGVDSFVWRGHTYYESGLYVDTLVSMYGCDSLVFLDLMLNTAYYDHQYIQLEQGEAYVWSGHYGKSTQEITITEPGDYFDSIPDANGCDSVFQLTVYVNYYTYDTTLYITYCPHEFYTFGDRVLFFPGTYTDSLKSMYGKDSVVTVVFDYYDTYVDLDTIEACGNSYTWRGKTYTESGEYMDTLQTIHGCDSLFYVDLRLYTTYSQYTYDTICKGDVYGWQDSIYAQAGTYRKPIIGPGGCESEVILVLDIDPCCDIRPHRTDTIVSQDQLPFVWFGKNYTQTGVYYDTLTNSEGCDSIGILNLKVDIPTRSDTTAVECEFFIWHGTTYTSSGDYDIHLINIAGCDSIRTLHLTINHATVGDTIAIACDSLVWHGTTYTNSGEYDYQTTNVAGCDSTCTLHLTINHFTISDTTAVACESFTWHGTTYTVSGDYVYLITNSVGCDSIRTLHLSIHNTDSVVENKQICQGKSYLWPRNAGRDTLITTAGDYRDTVRFHNSACDSMIYHLTLQVGEINKDSVNEQTCAGTPFAWRGKSYSASGVYRDTAAAQTVVECDTIYILNLSVNLPTTSDTIAVACESFTWHGVMYTTSGDYDYQTTNIAGCDSTRTLHLTINHVTTSDTTATACESFTWHGMTYTTNGDYDYQTTNAAGCDSTRTLHLTIRHASAGANDTTVCRNVLPLVWEDSIWTEAGVKIKILTNAAGCDSTVTLTLFVNDPTANDTTIVACNAFVAGGTRYTESGDYELHLTNAAGCDSVVTLHLTIDHCCPDTIHNIAEVNICDTLLPYTWTAAHTLTLDQAGEYSDTLRNDDGCDSILYFLTLTTYTCCAPMEATMQVPDVCADDASMEVTVTMQRGAFNAYRVHYTNAPGNAMPFRDTVVNDAPADQSQPVTLTLPVPHDAVDRTHYPRPDTYGIAMTLYDACGDSLQLAATTFDVLFPSWLLDQHWDDVIAILNDRYNGGYTFSDIRWLRDGEVIPGERELYIYLPHQLWTTPEEQHHDYAYQALLTRSDDGKSILTCPMTPYHIDSTNVLTEPYVAVAPTIVSHENPVVHVMTNTQGTYWIYSLTGKLLRTADYDPCDHEVFDIRLFEAQTMYILVFTPRHETKPLKEKYRAVKVMVE